MPDILEIMRRAALQAVGNQKPAEPVFGIVESASPLRISVDQKLTLGPAQLVLTRNMTDHEIEAEISASTDVGGDPGHLHGISGKKTLRMLCALQTGERVLMLRMAGGQKYIVIDRVVNE